MSTKVKAVTAVMSIVLMFVGGGIMALVIFSPDSAFVKAWTPISPGQISMIGLMTYIIGLLSFYFVTIFRNKDGMSTKWKVVIGVVLCLAGIMWMIAVIFPKPNFIPVDWWILFLGGYVVCAIGGVILQFVIKTRKEARKKVIRRLAEH